MKKSKYLTSSLSVILLLLSGCTENDFPEYRGPYLGQSPPGSEPQLFMPGLISTNYIDHCIGFLREGRVCVFSIWEKGTFYLYEKDGRWTQPEKVPWQNEPGTTDFTAGPDGNTVYFQSRRPTAPDDTKRDTNIWKVGWTGDGWTEPVPLPPPANTEEFSEAYPSVTPDGSVYFFTGSRPDSGIGDIYRSKLVGGKYFEAKRLPAPINSDYYEVDPFVAPDGSYLLFGSDRPGGYGLMDLYISFRREDGSWSHPFNTGPELNPFCIPTRMSVTPDGKYFFFPSRNETDIPKGEDVVSLNVEKWGDYDVYWVDTGFIDDLRDQYMGKKSAAGMVASEYRERGILSAVEMLNELYNTKQGSFYFELSEFMVICGDLMTIGKHEESEILYETLLKSIPEEFRVRQGYAIACILNDHATQGLDLIKEMWARFPSEKSEDMNIITFQLRRESRLEDELAVLRFITLEFPDSGLAHFNLAEAHEHYGNIEEALKSCTKALELKPAFEDAVEMRKRLEDDFPLLKGPYLGQKPPGMSPEIFAPEIFSKTQPEWAFDSVFSPCGNEFYFTKYFAEKDVSKIMCMKRVNDEWTKPEAVSFNGSFNNNNLCISPDGYRIFFKSWRPLPNSDTPEETSYIWYVHRTKSGWSEAQPVEYINEYLPAGHPSVSNTGTLYFRYRGKDNMGNADTHKSRFVNGTYSTPENLSHTLNTKYIEGDVCVAPDESFIIVACWDRPDNDGESDLYISFRDREGKWTVLENMGKPINTESNENNAMLSPDGKYLFFMRVKIENDIPKCETYWMDAGIIEELKPIDLK